MRNKGVVFTLVLAALAIGSAAQAQRIITARIPDPRPLFPDPVTDQDFYRDGQFDPKKVELGKFLFFDKILSGNQNISCASCHHPMADTGDGLSLPVGEGGAGLGVIRDTGELMGTLVVERVPRNAPPVFMLGAKHFDTMFHDGRVAVDPSQPSGFKSPAGDLLPTNLDNVLAAQAMFPVTSGTEMAGQAGENPIADASAAGDLEFIWERIAMRIRTFPEYVDLFVDAFDDVTGAQDITYAHAANAIAEFEASAWRADDSPFDRFVRGELTAMSPAALRGGAIFYTTGGCADCHSGKFMTDMDFHAIAMPQIGPGKGDGVGGHEDFGVGRETGNASDNFKFRTPTLRNVQLTAPYGHSGAFDTLEAVVRHHLDPVSSLLSYDQSQARLPSRDDLDAIDFMVMDDMGLVNDIASANELAPTQLSDRQVDRLVQFLLALTDQGQIDIRRDVPTSLPSGSTLIE